MARNNYPGLKKEQGIVAAHDCKAPCGGWVVLYDRKKGAALGIKLPIEETGRYILVHRPSNNCLWPFESLSQAREYTRAAAKGEDPTGGLLPRTTKPTKAEKAAAEFLIEGGAVNTLAPRGKTVPQERGHSCPPSEASPPPATTPEPDFHLDFKRRMAEKFPAETIAQKLDDLLNATKPVALNNLDSGEKETVDVPDWMAREKGIRIVIEMNVGKAKERPDIKEPVKRSFADLQRMCQSSPKARAFLRQQLDQWEREAQLTTTTDAHGAAKAKVEA